MKSDYLAYKRAASVSLLGLVLQLVMGLVLLAYGFLGNDYLARFGAYFVLFGIPIWLALWIVFDQHRRERIEQLETEALIQSGAREASAFNESADELRVALRRLNGMHRFLLPGVAMLLACAMALVGLLHFQVGKLIAYPADSARSFASLSSFGWSIAIGLSIAFIGFIFARYVGGMAKQPAWSNLRAGASASAGAAVVGLAIAACQFIDYIGPDMPVRVLHLVLPALMVVVAAEYVFWFLMGLYRPRKPGEFPPAAFHSRLLGFVAAPDRIAESIGGALNYQFGFNVTGSWFYRLVNRSVLILGVIALSITVLMTCLTVVQPNEQGLRVRFGQLISNAPLESGAYFKLPWPLERIETFSTTRARRIDLGVDPPKLQNRSILWTTDHGVTERYFCVQPSVVDRSAQLGQDTRGKDLALISAEIPLIYQVGDYIKFNAFVGDDARESLIRSIAQREVMTLLATESVDRVLGEGRSDISARLRKNTQAEFDRLNSGVKVLFIGIEGVHPPRPTAESFESVVQSGQRREGSVRTAEREANDQLIQVAGSVARAKDIVAAIDTLEKHKNVPPASASAETAYTARTRELEIKVEDLVTEAGGSAATTIQAARAERWTKHMGARARAEAQQGRVAAYRACPSAYKASIYFQTLREALSNSRVYLVGSDNLEVWPDLKDPEATGNIFLKPKE